MIWRFLRMLFSLKLKQRLDRPPRHYATRYDSKTLTQDVVRVFATTSARSPKNVEHLLRRHKVNSVDDLLPLLPSRQRKANPRRRLIQWWRRMEGLLPYDPTIPPALKRLIDHGRIPDEGTLIRRSEYPYAELDSILKGGDQDA